MEYTEPPFPMSISITVQCSTIEKNTSIYTQGKGYTAEPQECYIPTRVHTVSHPSGYNQERVCCSTREHILYSEESILLRPCTTATLGSALIIG